MSSTHEKLYKMWERVEEVEEAPAEPVITSALLQLPQHHVSQEKFADVKEGIHIVRIPYYYQSQVCR